VVVGSRARPGNIRPGLHVVVSVLGRCGLPGRLNFVLALPAKFAMVAAAHLS
jgi:hypothetical protein